MTSLNVASITLPIAISGGLEVEITSETSGLGGSRMDEGSPVSLLVLTRHFSDLVSSLYVASISLLNTLPLRLT